MTKSDNWNEFTDAPNEKWKKFFDQFGEIETLEVSKWKPLHLIAYFCKKYYETYNVKYSFKFNAPTPPKSFEVFQIKRLGLILSSDTTILKKYIDWAFEEKTSKAKRRLTSISFITNEELVNNYKLNVLLNNNASHNIDRSTPLPQEVYDIIFKFYGQEIKTYGDLAFLNSAYTKGLLDTITSALFQSVIESVEFKKSGFDLSILGKVK